MRRPFPFFSWPEGKETGGFLRLLIRKKAVRSKLYSAPRRCKAVRAGLAAL